MTKLRKESNRGAILLVVAVALGAQACGGEQRGMPLQGPEGAGTPPDAAGAPTPSMSHPPLDDASADLAGDSGALGPGAPPDSPPQAGGPAPVPSDPGMQGGDPPSMDAPSADPPDPTPTLIGDVGFSEPSQAFMGALQVALTTTISGAQIRFTTDGSVPNAASDLYEGQPLSLTQTTQVRARAFVDGQPRGQASTGLYVARDFDHTSNLPILIVDGYDGGKPTDKDVYLDAAVMLFEPRVADGTAALSALPALATRAGYHVRGQSSSRFPKTPYRLEFWDNADEDVDHPVLGMPAQSDWALISPYYDRTLIRNPFAYGLGRELGLEAPRTTYVEVYLSYEGRVLQQADYQGIYWFTETIKNAKARTNLKQLTPTDIELPAVSGGYIFKFDQAAAEEPELACTGSPPLPGFGGFGAGGGFGGPGGGAGGGGFAGGGNGGAAGTCWVDLEVVDPEPLAPEQATWLTEYLQAFHDSLHESPIGPYGEYIDVPSFVDYLIVNELSRNVDAYVRSAYYHKDRGGKLKAGPLWDYNFGLGLGGQTTTDPDGPFQYEGSRNVNNWYQRLTGDSAFMDAVRARWRELRQGLLSDEAIAARMAELAAPLEQAIEREYARWPVAEIYENPGIVRGSSAPDWQTQLDVMREFIIARAAKIDSEY